MAPHLFRGLRPRALSFDGSVPAHGTDGHRFAHRRAGGGERFFLPNSCHVIRYLPGLPGPDPGHFLLVQKVTKNTFKGELSFHKEKRNSNKIHEK